MKSSEATRLFLSRSFLARRVAQRVFCAPDASTGPRDPGKIEPPLDHCDDHRFALLGAPFPSRAGMILQNGLLSLVCALCDFFFVSTVLELLSCEYVVLLSRHWARFVSPSLWQLYRGSPNVSFIFGLNNTVRSRWFRSGSPASAKCGTQLTTKRRRSLV